jgi:pilus assembly protein CpaF
MLVRQTIARSLEIVVQLSRGTDGKRRVTSVSEITGTEGGTVTMQEIFRFDQTGVDEDGKILGEFRATGVRPRALERIARFGIDPVAIAHSFTDE